jgi:hypothetical protein
MVSGLAEKKDKKCLPAITIIFLKGKKTYYQIFLKI